MPIFGSISRPRAALARRLALVWLALWLPLAPAMAAGEPDVRVLIDVSGSMKANDPHNLRIPAVNLLVDLLPEGTHAGIWTFAKFVNMQVRQGEVDQGWRKKALREARSIHSRGLFTDIEQALDRATRSWGKTPGKRARHLILLTDGVVDVPGADGASEASRARIVDTLLPRIRSAGAQIHTVGLSENVDEALLVQLSTATNGQFNQIEDASVLQRVFLRLFEQAAETDALPLADNTFTVDSSIKELTLVVFRAGPNTERTRVTSPKGETFSVEDAPPGVRWRSDEGYDLITIPKPAKGKWRIDAAVDPDNRAMVVTDLKLRTAPLPAFAMPGTPIEVEAHLSDGEQIIDRAAFLEKVIFVATARSSDDPELLTEVELAAIEGAETAGHYRADLTSPSKPLEMEVLLQVDGGTFVREKRRRVRIDWPAKAYVLGLEEARAAQERDEDLPAEPLVLEVTANPSLVDLGSLSVHAHVFAPSGERITMALARQGITGADAAEGERKDETGTQAATEGTDGAGESQGPRNLDPNEVPPVWMVALPAPTESEDHRVVVEIEGETVAGEAFMVELAEIATPGQRPEPAPEVAPAEPAAPAPANPEGEILPTEEQPAEELDPKWLLNAALAGAANLVALAIVGGLWWWSRRRSRREMNEFMEAVQWSK